MKDMLHKCNLSVQFNTEIEKFIAWFHTHKAPVIQDSMISSVREERGLGLPPSCFTTNAANSMLKNQTNYKRSEMFEFEQQYEVERAIIGRGKDEL